MKETSVSFKDRGWYEFIVKRNKTTCVFHHPNFNKPFVGRTKCSPEDEFDLLKGENIARLRAHVKYHRAVCKQNDSILEGLLSVYKNLRKELFDHEDKANRLEDKIAQTTGKVE